MLYLILLGDALGSPRRNWNTLLRENVWTTLTCSACCDQDTALDNGWRDDYPYLLEYYTCICHEILAAQHFTYNIIVIIIQKSIFPLPRWYDKLSVSKTAWPYELKI